MRYNLVNFSPSGNAVGLLLYFRNILFNAFCYLFKTNQKKAFWLDLISTSSACHPSTPRNAPLVITWVCITVWLRNSLFLSPWEAGSDQAEISHPSSIPFSPLCNTEPRLHLHNGQDCNFSSWEPRGRKEKVVGEVHFLCRICWRN